MKDEIIGAVTAVTKTWTRQRKTEERNARAKMRRRQALVRRHKVTLKDAAREGMETAYLKASSGNTLPAHARQIMYAGRGEIQERTGERLDDKYFTKTLLTDYLRDFPNQTADWDVVFDARGNFHEPHTGIVVPLGTIDVREYLGDVTKLRQQEKLRLSLSKLFPTKGPEHRYSAILFVEKEGFLPLFRATNLAARYDIAIMSTKGLSVTASRLLVDRLCGEYDIPLLVLHDFDKAGFSILATLSRNTPRYKFQNKIKAIDLGLRLEDVQANDLEVEEVYLGSDPSANLRKNGATEEEIAFLCDGQRVELNAFASADLIAWIESKLNAHGIRKLVPAANVLEEAYRRAVQNEFIRHKMTKIEQAARKYAAAAKVLKGLAGTVKAKLQVEPSLPWDRAVAEMVRKRKVR